MNSLRKWLYKPRKEDTALLAQFYYVEEELTDVLNELDSFDGRKEPERCQQLVTRLRACQDKALSLITKMIQEALPSSEQAARDFRAKFPDDVLHDNLAGQLWFGAECLAAGSNILNRESESSSMRPLAKAVTRQLDTLRVILREQSLTNPRIYSEKVKDALRVFDNMFAEFEISYVSAMVPVKSIKEYEQHQNVIVLFSESLQRALRVKLVDQEQLDMCDPALMFTIPRLVIVYGLLMQPDTPVLCCNDSTLMPPMFKHFTRLLRKIRDLLITLSYRELYWLEMCLARAHDPNEQEFGQLPHNALYEQWQQRDVAGTHAQRQMAEIEQIFTSNAELKQLIDDIVAYIQYSAAKYGTRKRRHIDMRLVRKVRAKQIKYGKVEPPSDAGGGEDGETALLEQACEIGGRLSSRNHFKSTLDLIQRLYVCISGVADQLHHNFPADLRAILKTVFLVHQSSDDDDEEDDDDDDSGAAAEHDDDDGETEYVPPPPPSSSSRVTAAQSPRQKSLSADAAVTHSVSVGDFGGHANNNSSPATGGNENNNEHHAYHMLSTMRSGTVSGSGGVGSSPAAASAGMLAAMMTTSYSAPTLQPMIGGGAQVPPPAWVPDEYAVACFECMAPFTFVRRRHHCRSCGQVYCSACCSNFLPLPRFGYGGRPVRVCNRCRTATSTTPTSPSNVVAGVRHRDGNIFAHPAVPSRVMSAAESGGGGASSVNGRRIAASRSSSTVHVDVSGAGRISPMLLVPTPATAAVGGLSAAVSSVLHAGVVALPTKAGIIEHSSEILHIDTNNNANDNVEDDDMSPLTIAPIARGPSASSAFSSSTPIPPIMEDTNMALAQAANSQAAAFEEAAAAAAAADGVGNMPPTMSRSVGGGGGRRRATPPMLVINGQASAAGASVLFDSVEPSSPQLQTTSAEHIETLNHLLSPSSTTLFLDYQSPSSSSSTSNVLKYFENDLTPKTPSPFVTEQHSGNNNNNTPTISPLALKSTVATGVGVEMMASNRLSSGGSDNNNLDAFYLAQTK